MPKCENTPEVDPFDLGDLMSKAVAPTLEYEERCRQQKYGAQLLKREVDYLQREEWVKDFAEAIRVSCDPNESFMLHQPVVIKTVRSDGIFSSRLGTYEHGLVLKMGCEGVYMSKVESQVLSGNRSWRELGGKIGAGHPIREAELAKLYCEGVSFDEILGGLRQAQIHYARKMGLLKEESAAKNTEKKVGTVKSNHQIVKPSQ